MISIVICHRNLFYLERVEKNIESTIGVPYELLVIENSAGKYSIFEAYNLGVSQSQYPFICFAHEDILFHTENWGQKVIEHFKNENIGMIGVGGGNIFPKSPSAWWSHPILNDHLINNIQHWKTAFPDTPYQQLISRTSEEIITRQYNNPARQNMTEAVVLDGVWFCIRKELFNSKKIKFDTKLFKGFHNYDTDISLQVKEHAEVYVVYDILIEHFSQGTIDKSWLESALTLNRKWRDKLPVFAKQIDTALYPKYEWETFRIFVYWADAYGFSKQEIKKIIEEIYPFLPMDKTGKEVYSELMNNLKYGRSISKIISWMYR